MKIVSNSFQTLGVTTALLLLAGCATKDLLKSSQHRQTGESVVLAGEEPAT